MVKKNYKKLIIYFFCLLIFSIYLYADNFQTDIEQLTNVANSKYYKENIKILSTLEKKGYKNYQIYLLLAYNYIQIGEKGTSLVYLRKGLYFNKKNKLILDYIKQLEPIYYDDIVYFPFFVNFSPFVYILLLFGLNIIIFVLVILKKKKSAKFFIMISILIFFLLGINFIYPYLDKSAFTINQTYIYKYPTLNSPTLTNVKSAIPLKIKLVGRKFNYVILTNGMEGWILKKDIKKVFYDK